MNMKMGRDTNGNTVVRLTFPEVGKKGFSIQTAGNLPETHRTRVPNYKEILLYVRRYGTNYQKSLI